MNRIPRLVRLLALAAGLNILVLFLFRLIFLFWYSDPSDPMAPGALGYALYVGLKFDIRLATFSILPLALIGWLPYLNPFHNRWAQWAWWGYMGLSFAILGAFYALDFGYYGYLTQRLDATVMRFALDPWISLKMVWETYPVIWGTLAFVALVAGYSWAMARLFDRVRQSERLPLRKRGIAGVTIATMVVIITGLWGKYSLYPLRWSDAFFSDHNFAAHIATNPVLNFVETLKNRAAGFDLEQTKSQAPRIADFLQVETRAGTPLDFSREIPAQREVRPTPNVVLVILESFAHYKTGLSNNPLKPTPHFDALAQRSLYFPNFFTPHAGTARSVFATVTGVPDMELTETASRNPLIVDQHTIVNAFKDHQKYYFLGGSANWGNIRGVLGNNIEGLKIFEEGSYESDAIDVWGISDLHLFEEAHQVLQQETAPFFAIIQTSGNHRPYTIPEDNRGFEVVDISDAEVKRFGFISAAEYNAFRFMDHSIGRFLELVEDDPRFANTLFAFHADHGLPGTGEHIPKDIEQLVLTRHHSPLVIYGPGIVKAEQRETIASQVDVLPTLADLAGLPYRNTTLGRSLIDSRFDATRYAFTIVHGQPSDIGLIGERFFFRMKSDGSKAHLYRRGSDTPRDNRIADHPEEAAKMRALTEALYEGARYMLYHNGPKASGPHNTLQQPQD